MPAPAPAPARPALAAAAAAAAAGPSGAADDLFDSALNLEESHIQEGHEEGLRDGRRAGAAEGRALGVRRGFELGHELGFYAGAAQAWRHVGAAARPRAARAVAALEEALAAFPLADPTDERLQAAADEARGRYRAAAAVVAFGDAAAAAGGGADAGDGLQF